jgi:hypothetical protein
MVFRLMVSLRLSMAGGLPSKVTRGLIVLWLGRHGKPPINNRACIVALDRRTKGEDGAAVVPNYLVVAIPLKARLRLALPSKTSSSFAHAALKIGKMLMQLLEREAQRK